MVIRQLKHKYLPIGHIGAQKTGQKLEEVSGIFAL